MKKILLGTLCGISLCSIGQNMTLNENSGGENSYSIADIKKITFQSGEVIVQTQSSTENFSIDGVRNIVFEDIISSTERLTHDPQGLTAYPNPCGESLNINQYAKGAKYFIYDLNGSLVQSDKASSAIDVSNLKTGFYFFTLVDKTNTQTLRIIKK